MKIVQILNKTPVVNHRTIAFNTNNKSESIAKVISAYINDFKQFGEVFYISEILKSSRTSQEAKTYYLNEQQATLLLTYLRNSEIVRKFKIALVKEFYELRKNQNILFSDAQSHSDLLDALGYLSRTSKTAKDLANTFENYHQNAEMFLDRVQERFKDKKGVVTQCKRLPKHQIQD